MSATPPTPAAALSDAPLVEVLAGYGLGDVKTARVLEGGMFLRPLLIETARGRFVLRAHAWGGARRLDFLGTTLNAAAECGVRCARVLRRAGGGFGVRVNGALYAVHEYLPGRLYSWQEWLEAKREAAFLERVGRAVAHVHNALAALHTAGDTALDAALPPIQFHVLDQIRAQWDSDLAGARDGPLAEALRTRRAEIAAIWDFVIGSARSLGIADLPHQLVHGDLSPVNLVFRAPRGELWLIDWDCLHLGLRLYDALGDVLNRPPVDLADSFTVEWNNVRHYLDGYAAAIKTPLTSGETAAIPLFLAARQLEDLRQRMHGWAKLPEERHAEYAAMAQARVRLALEILSDSSDL